MASMAVEPDEESAAIGRMISEGAPDLRAPAIRARPMNYVCATCGELKAGPAAHCGTCGSRSRHEYPVEPAASARGRTARGQACFSYVLRCLRPFERRVERTRPARSMRRVRRHDARGACARLSLARQSYSATTAGSKLGLAGQHAPAPDAVALRIVTFARLEA